MAKREIFVHDSANGEHIDLEPTWLCPICGVSVYIIGETTDGRLIGSCKDAFTVNQWLN